MTTALALSFAAFSLSAPAFAVPAEIEPVAKIQSKNRSIAQVQSKNQAVAKQNHLQSGDATTRKVRLVSQEKVEATPGFRFPMFFTAAEVQPKEKAVAKQNHVQSGDATERTKRKVRMVSQGATEMTPDDRFPLLFASAEAQSRKQAVAKQSRVQSGDATEGTKRKVRKVRQETTEAAPVARFPRFFASADPVTEARSWIGTNPTDRSTLWCARFMNFVLERSGYQGTGSDAAKSFASYGRRISAPQVGAIAVMTRGKNGGHVGIVSGFDSAGNPVIISGNSRGRMVYEGVYPRGRIYAYVMPR